MAAFLDVIRPATLEVALAAMANIETERQALAQQWQQQLERTRCQADLARTRYEQVDPRQRLVAAELERRWEAALQEQQRLQAEWEKAQAEHLQPLSSEDEALIRQLANDLPALWAAETTTMADRKWLLRTLIADVTLNREAESGVTAMAIRWQTGAVTHLTAARPKPGHAR